MTTVYIVSLNANITKIKKMPLLMRIDSDKHGLNQNPTTKLKLLYNKLFELVVSNGYLS